MVPVLVVPQVTIGAFGKMQTLPRFKNPPFGGGAGRYAWFFTCTLTYLGNCAYSQKLGSGGGNYHECVVVCRPSGHRRR